MNIARRWIVTAVLAGSMVGGGVGAAIMNATASWQTCLATTRLPRGASWPRTWTRTWSAALPCARSATVLAR